MLTPLDFDKFKIPVPQSWKDRLSLNLARAASRREGSYTHTKGRFGGYTVSIEDAAVMVCDSDMIGIVVQCLCMSWNESMDFIEAHPSEANTVHKR